MSSTNKTLTIELSQYVGTDKPTYLSDYNGDMLKIDNAIAADRDSITTAQGKADGADAKADANASAISDLDSQVNNASNGLTKRVTDVEGDVNTIESLIGNGTPTTTDKTIIGAINELDTIKLNISALTASVVPVSPITGMSAANVQAAIEELAGATPTPTGYTTIATVTGDGTKTYATCYAELWTQITNKTKINPSTVMIEHLTGGTDNDTVLHNIGYSNNGVMFSRMYIAAGDSHTNFLDIRIGTTNSRKQTDGSVTTATDVSNSVVPNGVVISIQSYL